MSPHDRGVPLSLSPCLCLPCLLFIDGNLTHSLSLFLLPSLSLFASLPPSLPACLFASFPAHLPPCLPPCLPPSHSPSVSFSLSFSLSRPPSYSLSFSLSLFLSCVRAFSLSLFLACTISLSPPAPSPSLAPTTPLLFHPLPPRSLSISCCRLLPKNCRTSWRF